MRIQSASARASTRPSAAEDRGRAAVLAALAAEAPADDRERLAGRDGREQLGVQARPAGSAARCLHSGGV